MGAPGATTGFVAQGPPARRSNFSNQLSVRLIAFILFAASPFLWLAYVYVDQKLLPHHWPAAEPIEVNLRDLGSFPLSQYRTTIDEVPKRWRELDGRRVKLSGLISMPRTAGDLTEFQLVPHCDSWGAGPPEIPRRVFARVSTSLFAKVENAPLVDHAPLVDVVGTLRVRLAKDDDGLATSLYNLDVEKIEATH